MTEERLDSVEILDSLTIPKKTFDNKSNDACFLVYDEATLKVLNSGDVMPLVSDTEESEDENDDEYKSLYPSIEIPIPKELKDFEDFSFTFVNKTLQIRTDNNNKSFFPFLENLNKIIKICKSNRKKFKIKKLILASIYNSERMNSEKLVNILKKMFNKQRIYLSTHDRIFIEKLNRN